MSFVATVRVDSEPGGKKFQGVWLEREDGERWVIQYRPRACWTPFEGRSVQATGHTYFPPGQAISAVHFEVLRLEVLQPSPEDALVAVGPELERVGQFQQVSGQPGSKSEGSSWLEFSANDGSDFLVYNPSAAESAEGEVVVKGREVQRSPFTAHMGGTWLCVLDVKQGVQ